MFSGDTCPQSKLAEICFAVRPLDPQQPLQTVEGACRKVAHDWVHVQTDDPLLGGVALVRFVASDGTEFHTVGDIQRSATRTGNSLHAIQLIEPLPDSWAKLAQEAIRLAGPGGLSLARLAPRES